MIIVVVKPSWLNCTYDTIPCTTGTLLRGARLEIMRKAMDVTMVEQEAEILHNYLSSNRSLFHSHQPNRSVQSFLNPNARVIVNSHSHFTLTRRDKDEYGLSKYITDSVVSHYYDETVTEEKLTELIENVRKREEKILKALSRIEDDDDKNRYLMQRFCVNILSGKLFTL
jgi:hypothetical protein